MGDTWGTPSYMSPEQVTGAFFDARSDLFSLGSLCFELLTGQQAFQGDKVPHIVSPSRSGRRRVVCDFADALAGRRPAGGTRAGEGPGAEVSGRPHVRAGRPGHPRWPAPARTAGATQPRRGQRGLDGASAPAPAPPAAPGDDASGPRPSPGGRPRLRRRSSGSRESRGLPRRPLRQPPRRACRRSQRPSLPPRRRWWPGARPQPLQCPRRRVDRGRAAPSADACASSWTRRSRSTAGPSGRSTRRLLLLKRQSGSLGDVLEVAPRLAGCCASRSRGTGYAAPAACAPPSARTRRGCCGSRPASASSSSGSPDAPRAALLESARHARDSRSLGIHERPGTRKQPIVIGHRGASGYRPEHTLAAYQLAIEQGADFIEPDLVVDAATACSWRGTRTRSRARPTSPRIPSSPAAGRRRHRRHAVTGWFTEDFTLAELKTLRAKERLPARAPGEHGVRRPVRDPDAAGGDRPGRARERARRRRAAIGIYPETKHPTYFHSLGLSMEEPLVACSHANGSAARTRPVYIQSFEIANLKRPRPARRAAAGPALDRARQAVGLRRRRRPADLRRPGHAGGSAEIAEYADGIGRQQEPDHPARRRRQPAGPDSARARRPRAGSHRPRLDVPRREHVPARDFRVGTDPAGTATSPARCGVFLAAGWTGSSPTTPTSAGRRGTPSPTP